MFKKTMQVIAGGLLLLLCMGLAIYVATNPQRPDSESPSAAWLEPGPYTVAEKDFVFVDESRPTDANRGVPGKPQRTLPTTLWYPENLDGPHPLIVHSHGILSNRREMPYLMEALASRGYLVLAMDYPLSSGNTEGGATAADVGNQPGDISFLIDSLLALSPQEQPFAGSIDTGRIGLSGYSLGGLTTYLTTYHVQLRDPRIRAAVAIAGLSAAFAPQFFATTNIPYLAVSGTADALLEFARNAADLSQRDPGAAVLAIAGGTHLGFLGVADPMFRFMHNPDTLGCQGVLAAVGEHPNEVYRSLGGEAEGVDMQRSLPELCDYGFATALHPGRQRMINQIAVVSFFESVFNPDPALRAEARRELSQSLPADFPEASFTQ